MSNEPFKEFIKKERKKCENYLQSKNAFNEYPKEIESNIADCYENLAIIYKYFGDDNQYQNI